MMHKKIIVVPNIQMEIQKGGIERFLKEYNDYIKILFNGYQCVVQKL